MAKQRAIRILSPAGESEDTKPPNFYIWSWQPHFEIDVRLKAKALFEALDPSITVETFLVAINLEENGKPPAVVEPEDNELQPEDFAPTLKIAAQREEIAPGPTHGYPEGSSFGEAWAKREEQKAFHARVRHGVAQVIEGARSHDQPKIYVSPGRKVESYLVHSVLLVDRYSYDAHPALTRATRDDFSVVRSLMDAAAFKFVNACYDAILSSFFGHGHAEFPTVESILRAAGESFMYTPFGACSEFSGLHGGFETCNEISTLTYEKAGGRGRLILAREGHDNIRESVAFKNPPKLRNYRAVRKLLQLATDDEGLISDSYQVLALGTTWGSYDPTEEDLFFVEFVGHATWELKHAGVPLMRVEHGLPQLPKRNSQVQKFAESFERIFPNCTGKQKKQMRLIASAATALSHGAVVIVAENAAEEAARLATQSTPIEPQVLDERLMARASRIDGAMLVSPDGICHSIGVILDGQANDKGTPERGARFNSTVRYVYGNKVPCIGVVVSDDGMIDIVPKYRPRISSDDIQERINSLRDAVQQPKLDLRRFHKPVDWLDEHRFYLSESQCAEINALINDGEGKRDKSAMWIVRNPFNPHPDMNESYLR